MINLLIAERGSWCGGSATYLLNFVRSIDKSKFTPVIVYLKDSSMIPKFKKMGIEVILVQSKSWKAGVTLSYWLDKKWMRLFRYFMFGLFYFREIIPETVKLISIIRSRMVDAVLLNGEVLFFPSTVIACKFAGIPCFVRKSGTGDVQSRKFRYLLSFLVDYFIASSDAEIAVHKKNKFPYKKMTRVYEGVDPGRFYPDNQNKKIRKEFGFSEDQVLVGAISRFQTGKGHDDILKAAVNVIRECPDVIFLIVGDDLDAEAGRTSLKIIYENMAKELGIEKNVIFTGWRSDVLDILQGIDIFVHCPNTLPEGLGMATLEAQACGKPVIVTNNRGLSETTVDNVNGFKVEIGDFNALDESFYACDDSCFVDALLGSRYDIRWAGQHHRWTVRSRESQLYCSSRELGLDVTITRFRHSAIPIRLKL